MAWDNYEVGGLELISGDILFDELGGAIKRIRRHYLERFGRNPYFGELLYTLRRIAELPSRRVIEDLALPAMEALLSSLDAPTHHDQFDPGHYVGGFNDYGELLIWPESAPSGQTGFPDPVLRVEVEDYRPEEVICRYTPLSPDISDAAARCLIRLCALRNLLRYDILDPKLVVQFEKSDETRGVP